MDRFGFRFTTPDTFPAGIGFTFATTFNTATPGFASANNVLTLQMRDATGAIITTFPNASLPPTQISEWVYWPTPPTRLTGGVQYIFTSYLLGAFDPLQQVAGGSLGDTLAGYAGGGGWVGLSPLTPGGPLVDMNAWTSWAAHAWDFDFRVQQRNPACR
jgi:hypothetical protein